MKKKFYFYPKGVRVEYIDLACEVSAISIGISMLRLISKGFFPPIDIIAGLVSLVFWCIAIGYCTAKIVFDYKKNELRIFDIKGGIRRKFSKIKYIEIWGQSECVLQFSVDGKMFVYGHKKAGMDYPSKENFERMTQVRTLLLEIKSKYGC
jgi:hypothetical protein